MPESNALARLNHLTVASGASPSERKRTESLRRYAPLVKYVVDRIATGLPKSIEKDDLINKLKGQLVQKEKAIKELEVLPQKIVFYNTGVKLGATDSGFYEHLHEIEKMGVELLFCATCVEYYTLEDKIKIGIQSNMYEIAQILASASNVIKP